MLPEFHDLSTFSHLSYQPKRRKNVRKFTRVQRKAHALAWADFNQKEYSVSYAGYARQNDLSPQMLASWVNGEHGVVFSPEEQIRVNTARDYVAQQVYSVNDRKAHALAWADFNQKEYSVSYSEYTRQNGMSKHALREWVNGNHGVVFSPEEQIRVNTARDYVAQQVYSVNDRKAHALAWADFNQKEYSVSYSEYARQNGIHFNTFRAWFNGGSVVFTAAERAMVSKAMEHAGRNSYSVNERKTHVLAWADGNQNGYNLSYGDYCLYNELNISTFTKWVNGKGVPFSPEEQIKVKTALRHARDQSASLSDVNAAAAMATGRRKHYDWMGAQVARSPRLPSSRSENAHRHGAPSSSSSSGRRSESPSRPSR